MVVPTVLAMMARRNWLRWVDSGIGPDKTSATAMAKPPVGGKMPFCSLLSTPQCEPPAHGPTLPTKSRKVEAGYAKLTVKDAVRRPATPPQEGPSRMPMLGASPAMSRATLASGRGTACAWELVNSAILAVT